jgi:hypothetical protein
MLHTALTVRMLKVIAGVAGCALVLWAVNFPAIFRSAEAANLTSVSDTLSDSDLGALSNHTIRFTTPNGLVAGQTVVITFPTSPDNFVLANSLTSGLDFNDLDIIDDGTEQTLAASNGAGQWGVATTTTSITLTSPSDSSVGSSSVIIIEIGTNATTGASGDTQITNPDTTGSYEITIGGSMVDSGAARVAIVDNVVVTAQVDTNFSFAVTGLATSSTVNGTTTTASTSPTTIPFAQLSAGVIQTLAQELSITTNAANGFAVTVYQDILIVSCRV